MDLTKTGWFGRVEISGLSQVMKLEGSIQQMIPQIMMHLIQAKSRVNGEGNKTIHITFGDSPLSDARVEELRKAQELAASIPAEYHTEEPTPMPGEDMLTMAHRLHAVDSYPPAIAMWYARQAFGYGVDPETEKWANDSKAQLFNKLNASDRAAESADPTEYAALKAYMQETYPKLFATMTPRR